MSAPAQPLPGWYPDVTNVRRLRYFDGRHWTDDYADEFGRPLVRRAAEGMPTGTVWIWLHLLLPWLAPLLFLLVDWRRAVARLAASGTTLDGLVAAFADPALVIVWAVNALVPVLLIVVAELDWAELRRRRMPEPFHWAWSLLGWNVYPIGRGIVTQRRTGRGGAVTWVAVGLLVVELVLTLLVVAALGLFARLAGVG